MAIITRCFWPPRQPERVLVDAALRLGQADPARAIRSPCARACPAAQIAVCASIASTICAPTRITGFRLDGRLLEDHADAPAAHRAHAQIRAAPSRSVAVEPRRRPAAMRARCRAAGASARARSCSCRSPIRRRARRSRRARSTSVRPSTALHQAGVRRRVRHWRGRRRVQHLSSTRFVMRRARRVTWAGAGGTRVHADRTRRARRRRTGWRPAPAPP